MLARLAGTLWLLWITALLPNDREDTEDKEDWRLDNDGCGGGPSGRQDSTEALICSMSAPFFLAEDSFGLILILIFLIGSKSSESESELELLMVNFEFLVR